VNSSKGALTPGMASEVWPSSIPLSVRGCIKVSSRSVVTGSLRDGNGRSSESVVPGPLMGGDESPFESVVPGPM
jgi:hypothetical protein